MLQSYILDCESDFLPSSGTDVVWVCESCVCGFVKLYIITVQFGFLRLAILVILYYFILALVALLLLVLAPNKGDFNN